MLSYVWYMILYMMYSCDVIHTFHMKYYLKSYMMSYKQY